MSAAQTAIKIWILIEKFDNDVDVTPFTSRAAALAHLNATNYAEEDGYADAFLGDENADGGILEFGDDYVALRPEEMVA